ncbi:DeoR/GlpR family DNA-binding transcription regulator [Cohnella cellulosilytica]|uniref:DeoR/GlpR family DNA-binding transcription regulator n=1 Tax=Cohnella cellulosilytica TaxID=986710 RepID=A0ABW2F7R3_9BACL
MKERWSRILTAVNEAKEMTVADLSKQFAVSEVTIRKDLIELENQGLLIRRHGSAVAPEQPNIPPFLVRSRLEASEKEAIARAAAALIDDGDSVLIDAGTTPLAAAVELKQKKITIITNSLPVGLELADGPGTVSLACGELIAGRNGVAGPDTEHYLERIRANWAIIGASGFQADHGFSTSSAIEAATKKKMIEAASKVILVVDHSKFARIKPALFAAFERVDVVVTSVKTPPAVLQDLQARGIQVIAAEF